MSLIENELTPCTKCNGDGNVGNIEHNNIKYKILCPKCLGKRYLDWIEQTRVVELKRDALIIILYLQKHTIPDNYLFVYGRTTYFINKDYFNYKIKISEKWNNIRMSVQFLKNNAHLLEMWSNKDALWQEISII